MKYKFILLSILSVEALFAQNPKYVVNPNPIWTFFVSDTTDHIGSGELKNNFNDTITLYWYREIVEMPQAWSTLVCDCNTCYADIIGKCPETKPNVILVHDSCALLVHVHDDGNEGVAHVIIWLYEKEDTTKKLRADYYFNKILSNNEVRNIEMKVYPNPANNYFTIEYNQGLNRIELYSILGKKVTSYKTTPHGSYDIGQLEDGIYFVKLIGPNERNLRTIRLQKNH